MLLIIFSYLDDLSLWSISQVSKQWCAVINSVVNQSQWKSFVSKRWILYRPSIKIPCYHALYTQLVLSSCCFYCLQRIACQSETPDKTEEFKKSWRHRRLLLELKSLQQDPPDGIVARPLDASCFSWQAAINGPPDSPYEGGVFFLHLNIPKT